MATWEHDSPFYKARPNSCRCCMAAEVKVRRLDNGAPVCLDCAEAKCTHIGKLLSTPIVFNAEPG